MSAIERAREAAWERLIGHRALREKETTKADADAVIETFLLQLAAEGMVVVREAVLAEKIARLMCGFDLHPDNMVPISNPNDPWGDPIGEQTMWEANMPAARAMIAAASAHNLHEQQREKPDEHEKG